MKIVVAANSESHPYAPQLQVRAFSLAPGKEWAPPISGWGLIQVADGSGYWLHGPARTELDAGTVVLAAGAAPGRVLASCLNGMSLQFFTVMPERLSGLVTQGEQDFFNEAASRREFYRVLSSQSAIALKMTELCGARAEGGLLSRLILLQLLVEAFGKELPSAAPSETQADVKDRLRLFLQETPPAALLEIGFDELARLLHCTPRHLSRVFYDVTGTSFRQKRVEMRLARALELLATSQSKVVDVAFKSGFKSLSLFNRMFTRQFGISPGRWRQRNENGGPKKALSPNGRSARLAVSTGRTNGF